MSEIWKNTNLKDIDGEVWRDVIGYEGLYQVSNLGRVKSLDKIVDKGDIQQHRKERILKILMKRDGYLTISLRHNKVRKIMSIHRLVAINFMPNKNNKLEVNHINTNKKDNRLENLEWCTRRENMIHAYANNLIDMQKPVNSSILTNRRKVKMFDVNKNLISIFDSLVSAQKYCKEIGLTKTMRTGAIHHCLNKISNSAYGFVWEYANKGECK